jgi:hypothetical protein
MARQYLTYAEYQQFGGTLTETEFALAEFKARSRIDRLTLARVQAMQEIPEEVKMAMLCIIKVDSKYSADAMSDSAIVSAFNTDGYSESYGGIAEQSDNAQTQLNQQLSKMLFGVLDDNGVPLLYRGIE